MPDNEDYFTENRYLYLRTPIGPNKLLLLDFNGFEAMSELFRFQLKCEAENSVNVDFRKIIGKEVSFGVVQNDFPARHFNGICIQISQGGRGPEFTEYTLEVVPKLWTLTQKHRSRIFQQKKVTDIIQAVFTGIDADYRFDATYEPREYCVQYRESDFDFASRLMEEEGIYYYFKFTDGAHKLVVTDKDRLTEDVPDQPQIPFDSVGSGGHRAVMKIHDLRRVQDWRTGKVTLWDHHFQLPHRHNEVEKEVIATIQGGAVSHSLKVNGNNGFEFYEYPAGYAHWFDGINKSGGEQPKELGKISSQKTRIAGIRMQQEEIQMLQFVGASNCRNLTPGYKFTLEEHFNANGPYIVTSVSHTGQEGSYRSARHGGRPDHYENSFTCIPQELKFRAQRRTPKARVAGCQTAVVVGPPGEEIFTDKYGRIKVQFHWDRDGQNDANSSCWLRVANMWAGQKWGSIFTPRIGMEVLVDFLEGDPDRPIAVGCLYNDREMPPYTLPDNKTQSGVKSRSSKGGGPDNYNEIRFEDKKGVEMLTIHAEKDMEREVEHDDRIDIGNDQKIDVHHDRTKTVDNNETIYIKNNRTTKIGQKDKEEVGGDQETDVKGNTKHKAGQNNNIEAGQNVTIKAGMNLNLEAGMMLTLKAGAGKIVLGPTGVMIDGAMTMINCGAAMPPPVPPVVIVPIPPSLPAPPTPPALPGGSFSPPEMPSIPQVPPMPALPNPAQIAGQVGSMVQNAINTASGLMNTMANVLMDQINGVVNMVMDAAENLGQAAASAAGAIRDQLTKAVEDAKKQITDVVNEVKEEVEGVIDQVIEGATEAVEEVCNKVAELEDQAAAALNSVQEKISDTVAQAEQLLNEAKEKGEQALQDAAEKVSELGKQLQSAVDDAKKQLEEIAAEAEKMANEAIEKGQQELNAVSQKLDALADQGKKAVEEVKKGAEELQKQAEDLVKEGLAQGEKAVADAVNSIQEAANEAKQAAEQALDKAQQAAEEAREKAEKMAEDTKKQVEDAVNEAKEKISNAADEAAEKVGEMAKEATQKAAEAGQMAQEAAQKAGEQIADAAAKAGEQVANTAEQTMGQVSEAAGKVADSVANAFKGLGR